MKMRPALALLAGTFLALPAFAADPVPPAATSAAATPVDAPVIAAPVIAAPTGKQPIDITADQTLEWHRDDQQYLAYGHVVAVQGTAISKADKMIADYRPKQGQANGTGPIYRLTGIGHVILLSEANEAFGDKVIYNVDTSIGVLTGEHLVANSPEQTITARDNFTYNSITGQMTANGAARLVRPLENGSGNDVITADTMSAWFVPTTKTPATKTPATLVKEEDAKTGDSPVGRRHLDHMTADGHVVITTPTEILHGEHATYNAATQIATVTGHVRIDRGPNVMTGDKAQVNMQTNVSKMIADEGNGKRVHALFYPGTSDESDPANVSHGDTAMPDVPSAASPGDALIVMPAPTDAPPITAPATPPVTVENAADPNIDVPLSTPRIGAP